MRFISTPIAAPEVGDVREKSAFLIFPKRIGEEIRFLERAVWEEVYLAGIPMDNMARWSAVLWLNE